MPLIVFKSVLTPSESTGGLEKAPPMSASAACTLSSAFVVARWQDTSSLCLGAHKAIDVLLQAAGAFTEQSFNPITLLGHLLRQRLKVGEEALDLGREEVQPGMPLLMAGHECVELLTQGLDLVAQLAARGVNLALDLLVQGAKAVLL